jgi:hypothetical protein
MAVLRMTVMRHPNLRAFISLEFPQAAGCLWPNMISAGGTRSCTSADVEDVQFAQNDPLILVQDGW